MRFYRTSHRYQVSSSGQIQTEEVEPPEPDARFIFVDWNMHEVRADISWVVYDDVE